MRKVSGKTDKGVHCEIDARFAQFLALSLLTRLLQHSHYDNITRVVTHHKF